MRRHNALSGVAGLVLAGLATLPVSADLFHEPFDGTPTRGSASRTSTSGPSTTPLTEARDVKVYSRSRASVNVVLTTAEHFAFRQEGTTFAKNTDVKIYATLDSPEADPSQAEIALENQLGYPVKIVASETDIPEPATPAAPATSGTALRDASGYAPIKCDKTYNFSDAKGTFTLQRGCKRSTAPWQYRLSPAMRALAGSNIVRERGMSWFRNFVPMGMMRPHIQGAAYIFHGTFNPAKKNDLVSYHDTFSFRHNVSGGGTAVVSISGGLNFK